MKCAECGARLASTARYCHACGRRVPQRIEPLLHGAPRLAHPREASAAERTSSDPHAELSRLVERHGPKAVVALGCVLAAGVYASLLYEDAAALKAGEARLAAATGAAATPLPAAAGEPLATREALRALYGNYDPVLDGALWVVSGAPQRWREWNGRTVAMRPLVSRSDPTGARHVLVTNAVELKGGIAVKQGAACRTCKTLLSAAVFERRDGAWSVTADHRFVTVDGAWGAPPHVAVAFLPRGEIELRIARGSAANSKGDSAVVAVLSDAGLQRTDPGRR